ncbi:MAG: amidohydrolase family protein [Planctomycetota bacterium]|nr:amidohydrolase family protein [Planctomycetota bacterium]
MKNLVTVLSLSLVLLAAADTPDPAPADIFQVRAKVIYLGDGKRIEDGVLVVEDGRIRKVGRGVEIDDRYPVIEHDGVLSAGIVACQTHSGAAGESHDETLSILPEMRLVYAFDPSHSDFSKALRAGITSVVLAPTAQNLAGGQTCVVKTAGGRVLEREAHLALSFSQEALRQGSRPVFFFFAPQDAAVDDGFENTGGSQNGSRYPTSYSGSLAELEERLMDVDGPFAQVADGELPVLMEAWDRNEVARAVGFAKKHGLRGAIRGAPLAGELAELLSGSGLGVILGPFDLGHAQRSLDALPALADAGVPFAFALDAPSRSPEQMRLSAAMAVRAGVDPLIAWRALTSDAAQIAGVGEHVGRLETGMDADFVLWSGDPMNLASGVEAVFVDGKLAYHGDR